MHKLFLRPCLSHIGWSLIFTIWLSLVPLKDATADVIGESFSHLYQGVNDFSEKIFPGRKTMITIGLGPKYSPDYLGSDDYDVDLDIAFYIKLKRFAASSSGLSFDFLKHKSISFGPFVKFTGGRKEKVNDALTGLGNINKSVHLGLYGQYVYKSFSFRLSAIKDITSWHQGWQGKFRVSSLIYHGGKWTVLGSVDATWGDDDYSATWFGIDDDQSVASGYAVYDAGSGIRDVAVHVSSRYTIGDHWSIDATVTYRRLMSGPADSPIVADEGSRNQLIAAIYGSYSF